MVADIGALEKDLLGFVYYVFPWGEAGTELEHDTGPRDWQSNILIKCSLMLKSGAELSEVIRYAVASGHGIGKSALVAWLILWAMSTMADTRGVVTANTEPQLQTKTWPELAKWHRLACNGHWFRYTATSLCSADPKHEKTWRIDALPWNEHRPESFAGLHNVGRRILVIFDEASAIHDIIWETVEGALTDENTQILWFAFGNPTRNTGRFRECFGSRGHRWETAQIDSRTVPGTNKKQMDEWVKDYTEDSDFVRVRIRGVFPRAGDVQFISSEAVANAMARAPSFTEYDPVIMGVDPARFGDDESVIYVRRGRDGKDWGIYRYRGWDTMKLAAQIVHLAGNVMFHLPANAIFIDGTGVGGGVVDRCRQLGLDVIEVNFGGAADGAASGTAVGENYLNKRAEMWGSMRAWLETGSIPDEPQLEQDLIGPEYGISPRGLIQLEKKSDMKKRGLPSPNIGDALALTFAYEVSPTDMVTNVRGSNASDFDYDPLDY